MNSAEIPSSCFWFVSPREHAEKKEAQASKTSQLRLGFLFREAHQLNASRENAPGNWVD